MQLEPYSSSTNYFCKSVHNDHLIALLIFHITSVHELELVIESMIQPWKHRQDGEFCTSSAASGGQSDVSASDQVLTIFGYESAHQPKINAMITKYQSDSPSF